MLPIPYVEPVVRDGLIDIGPTSTTSRSSSPNPGRKRCGFPKAPHRPRRRRRRGTPRTQRRQPRPGPRKSAFLSARTGPVLASGQGRIIIATVAQQPAATTADHHDHTTRWSSVHPTRIPLTHDEYSACRPPFLSLPRCRHTGTSAGRHREELLVSTFCPDRADSTTTAMAWVETPLQLLSVVEPPHRCLRPAHAGPAPRGSPSLADTVTALAETDLPDGLTVLPAVPSLAPHHSGSGVWFIGDAFSGQVQRPCSAAAPATTSSWTTGSPPSTCSACSAAAPQSRWSGPRVRSTLPRRLLGLAAARKIRAAARTGRVTVFTMLPLPDRLVDEATAVGIRIITHDFPWLRSLPGGTLPRKTAWCSARQWSATASSTPSPTWRG